MTILDGNPYIGGRFDLSPAQQRELQWSFLANSLIGLGAGISQAGAAGQPWMTGVAPGAAMAASSIGATKRSMYERNAAQAQFEQQEALRKAQEESLRTTTKLKERELAMGEALLPEMLAASRDAGSPGFNVQPSPVQMGPNPEAVRTGQQFTSYLTAKHNLSPVAAGGVVGGLFQESGFDPGYGFTRPGGDNGTAHGMGQWRFDRAAGLKKFAQAQGKPVTDPYVQLDYLVSEMKGGDMGAQRAWAMLQQAKTPQEATTAMMHFFRPAGYTPANPTAGHGYTSRVQYAQNFSGLASSPPGLPIGDSPQADGSGTPLPPRSSTGMPPNYVPVVPGPSNVSPDRFMPGLMHPMIKPFAQAQIDRINRQNDQYFKQLDLERNYRKDADEATRSDREFGLKTDQYGLSVRDQELKDQNAAVRPDGSVNQAVIDAKAAEEKAKREAELDSRAAETLVSTAVKKFVDDDRPKGLAIQSTVPQIHNVRRLIEAGALTGTGAGVRNTLSQIASTFGFQSDAAAITPAYMAALAQQIVANAKALGVNPTDRDAAIIKDAQGANADISKDGMLKLLDVQENLQRQAHKRYLEEAKRVQGMRGVKSAYGEDYFMLPDPPSYADWLKDNPLPGNSGDDLMKRYGLTPRGNAAMSPAPKGAFDPYLGTVR